MGDATRRSGEETTKEKPKRRLSLGERLDATRRSRDEEKPKRRLSLGKTTSLGDASRRSGEETSKSHRLSWVAGTSRRSSGSEGSPTLSPPAAVGLAVGPADWRDWTYGLGIRNS